MSKDAVILISLFGYKVMKAKKYAAMDKDFGLFVKNHGVLATI